MPRHEVTDETRSHLPRSISSQRTDAEWVKTYMQLGALIKTMRARVLLALGE